MKKHFIIWACAVAALLFTACQKEKAASEKPAPEEPQPEKQPEEQTEKKQ